MNPSGWSERALTISVFIIGAIYGACISFYSGQDVNWDWQNYHDYTAWAFLNWRYSIDVHPAGIQSFLNPLISLPGFLLNTLFPRPLGGVLLGAIQGTALGLVWVIARQFSRSASFAVLSVAAAASGPMLLTEMGTSFPDLLGAIPVLVGVFLLFSRHGENGRSTLWAGVWIGVAVGLKLSNAPYAFGAIAACGLFQKGGPSSLLRLGAGGVLGGTIATGPWCLYLWHRFGNPVFPFYNGIFRSPDGPAGNISDPRFLPEGLSEFLLYPIYILLGQYPTAEIPFADPRYAMLGVMVLFTAGAIARSGFGIFEPRDRQLFLFFAVSWIVWLMMFAIQRYVVVLEMLAGLVILLILLRTVRLWQPFAVLSLVLVLWGSARADWGHFPWAHPYDPDTRALGLEQPATFFILGEPLAYLARHLPPGSRFVSISASSSMPIPENGEAERRILNYLANPLSGGTWSISYDQPQQTALMHRFGLLPTLQECRSIAGVGPAIYFCPISHDVTGRINPQ